MHTPRGWTAAVLGPDGLIYAIGGATQSVGSRCRLRRAVLAAAVDPNGFICVVGGDNPGIVAPTANAYLYNPASPGWISQPPMSGGRAILAATTGPDGLIYAIGGTDSNNTLATVAAFTSDKCYPIEQKIAAVQSELSTVQGDVGDIPPKDRAAAEKQIIALGLELKGLEAQLKTCQGG